MPDSALFPPFDAYQGNAPYVFVSYSHADSEHVFPEIARLHEQGLHIWFDEGIDPGNEWPDEIANALTSASVFLVFLSPRSAASRNVKNEINFALNSDKPFLAIHLEETKLPSGLALRMGDIQAILRYRMNSDSYWRKLLRSLTARLQIQELSSPAANDPSSASVDHKPTKLARASKSTKQEKKRDVRGEDCQQLPPITLLLQSAKPQAIRADDLQEEAKVLVEKCNEFGVRGEVTQINPGPIVTTFEFKPEAGVKYSRVIGLANDLCVAMRSESMLIERIAGKSTVGIQVPSVTRETIHLRDVLESETFVEAESRLTLAMGKDTAGRIVTADLASMPHLLIAGSTGSGKSTAINAMIVGLLFRAAPSRLRLILVAPREFDLGIYKGLPHLSTPIITDAKLASNALRDAVGEMERRLKLLAGRGGRNIEGYNKLIQNVVRSKTPGPKEEQPLPYIVIIIDELADLMMQDPANVEDSITRLAQMARAVGIHLIVATQQPSEDVFAGLIKANFPARISFQLATKGDSRAVLDSNGAEALLGRGDMLFLPPGTGRMVRLHAPYVSEEEIAAVVDFWKAQGTATPQFPSQGSHSNTVESPA